MRARDIVSCTLLAVSAFACGGDKSVAPDVEQPLGAATFSFTVSGALSHVVTGTSSQWETWNPDWQMSGLYFGGMAPGGAEAALGMMRETSWTPTVGTFGIDQMTTVAVYAYGTTPRVWVGSSGTLTVERVEAAKVSGRFNFVASEYDPTTMFPLVPTTTIQVSGTFIADRT